MKVTEKDVCYVADLANLELTEAERTAMVRDLNSILEIDPQNENVTYNFARFLHRESGDLAAALGVLSAGIERHPDSGRLLLLQGC